MTETKLRNSLKEVLLWNVYDSHRWAAWIKKPAATGCLPRFLQSSFTGWVIVGPDPRNLLWTMRQWALSAYLMINPPFPPSPLSFTSFTNSSKSGVLKSATERFDLSSLKLNPRSACQRIYLHVNVIGLTGRPRWPRLPKPWGLICIIDRPCWDFSEPLICIITFRLNCKGMKGKSFSQFSLNQTDGFQEMLQVNSRF